MTPFIADEDFTLYVGNCLDVLRAMPAESVDCVVTSPPYWGLRDYGTATWDGGDPECDHVADRFSTTVSDKASNAASGSKQARDVCPKCGARRVETTIWGGDPSHEHKWGERSYYRAMGTAARASGEAFTGAGDENAERLKEGRWRADATCDCGAWRGQLGLEPTPQEFVAHLVELFREIRRVLTKHGTCWVNLGDSYVGGGRGGADGKQSGSISKTHADAGVTWGQPTGKVPGLKSKDLAMVPARFALAMQDDGWWLRAEVVWSKPNPMPESVTDRPTKSHENIYLFTKTATYWYDQEPTREQFAPASEARYDYAFGGVKSEQLADEGYGRTRPIGKRTFPGATADQQQTLDGEQPAQKPAHQSGNWSRAGHDARMNSGTYRREYEPVLDDGGTVGRNMRSVWEVTVQPYRDAHFATFPAELPRRCILSGCPEFVCRTCGKPRVRMFEVVKDDDALKGTNWDKTYEKPEEDGDHVRSVSEMYRDSLTRRRVFLGWSDCGHDNYRRGVVLDPFMGSGTTAKVARDHGRHAVGIELNEEYAQLIADRTRQLSLGVIA